MIAWFIQKVDVILAIWIMSGYLEGVISDKN